LLIEKTILLKQTDVFRDLAYRYLYYLAKELKLFDFESDLNSNLNLNELKDKILFIHGNSVLLIVDQGKPIVLQPDKMYFFNRLISSDNSSIAFERKEDSIIYYIEKDVLIYNMFDYHEIEISVLKWLNKQLETEVTENNQEKNATIY